MPNHLLIIFNQLLIVSTFFVISACTETPPLSSNETEVGEDSDDSTVAVDLSNVDPLDLSTRERDGGTDRADMTQADMTQADMTQADMTQADNDQDGHPSSVDCHDGDPLIFPGAAERCNGLDDDCDMIIDEGEELEGSLVWYQDLDLDQYGNAEVTLRSCDQPIGYVSRAGDCDEESILINPSQPELCDGLDNNCNMIIDDGVISDGSGCQDPGYTPAPQLINAQLTLRNGDNAGDDGTLEFELYDGVIRSSYALNNISWDDHMRHTVDVYTMDLEERGMTYDGLGGGQGRLFYDDSDAWAVACAQLTVNGIVVSCDLFTPSITLDSGARESITLPLPSPLPTESLPCTCYDQYLSHGPVIGATGPHRVRLWGRTDATRRVIIKVGVEESDLETVAYRYPTTDRDHTFEVDLSGLTPNTTYHYVIDVEGQLTNGQFKTAPVDGTAGHYKFAVGSCAKTVPSRHPEQPIFGAIINSQPDMMFMLGDNVYFDSLSNGDAPDMGAMRSYYRDAIQRRTSWGREHYPPLNVYDPNNVSIRPSTFSRSRWWGSFGRDQRADLFASTPILAIWDDHDFYSNNADAFYNDDRGRKPWTLDSIRVFDEYWPNPDGGLSRDQISQRGIFFKQSWGDVDIFGLDTRFHRDDSREHMLGRAQMDWIKRELSASTATFKLILSGSIFAGDLDDQEKWPHFEADRDELFSHIWSQGVGGVVLMSGDIHISSILEHRNPRQINDPYALYEIISSGLANYGPSAPSGDDYGSLIQMRYMPPFIYDRAKTTVFAVVEIDSDQPNPSLSVQFIDEYGNSACADCPFIIQRSALGPQ